MVSEDGPLGPMAVLGTVALVAISILLLSVLPSQLLTLLTAWILVSFPIGVLLGHCVLSEE
jgi:hypothetical protein